jgi:UDP-N-acetylmuramate-alanine ligase
MGFLIMKLLRHDTFVESNLVLDYLQCHREHPVADISLQIPGVHNVLNSLAVSEIFLLSFKKKKSSCSKVPVSLCIS